LNVSRNTKRNHPTEATGARSLLGRVLKGPLIAAVVLGDLAYGTLSLPRQKPPLTDPVSPTAGSSCERGTCQRDAMERPSMAAGVAVPTGKPRLLEFTSKHCTSCGKMAPLVRKIEHECTAHDGTILPVDVDTDAGDLLATRYRVDALPTFVMVDSNGEEVRRLVGEQPRERLTVALADVNGVICQLL
jgi:thiol:disulfide interchange protein DsbD